MNDLLAHRGPDESGLWFDGLGYCGFGHRRLSILDLSPTGRQPMQSKDGRYSIAFNGEIYNHEAVRGSLMAAGAAFAGRSDTEVLIEGVVAWGLEETVRRCAGMFAVALWDRESGTLALARDRVGEKPLYVFESPEGVAFSSELAPLVWLLDNSETIDRTSLAMLMTYGYVPDDRSILSGIRKVRPATIERWRVGGEAGIRPAAVARYWRLDAPEESESSPARTTVDDLSSALLDVASEQLQADVPVGVFLSGGVDSTVVAAAAQKVSSRPISTFCIGFDDKEYDESKFAGAIAEYLGTDHTVLMLEAARLVDLVPQAMSVYDEPLADASQIATVMAAQLARRHVKVALSGDGGDEMFGGYNRYYWPQRVSRWASMLPLSTRRSIAVRLKSSSSTLGGILGGSAFDWLLRKGGPIQALDSKIMKAASLVGVTDPVDAYLLLVRRWQTGFDVLDDWDGYDPLETRLRELARDGDSFRAFLRWDIECYLPGDNLTKVDRASMSVGLESRAPLLDHRIVTIARRLVAESDYRTYQAMPKWPLKRLLERWIPASLFKRPKMGFSVPLAKWLRGELRDWAGDSINELGNSAGHGLKLQSIRAQLAAHVAGREDNSARLWPVLAFCQWRARIRNLNRSSGPRWNARSTYQ